MRKSKPWEILLTEQHRYWNREKTALEQRVEELERIVRELIQYKQDIEVVVFGADWKPIWYSKHEYNMKN
jgi:hypothetical protein